jgi:hypothetical protein
LIQRAHHPTLGQDEPQAGNGKLAAFHTKTRTRVHLPWFFRGFSDGGTGGLYMSQLAALRNGVAKGMKDEDAADSPKFFGFICGQTSTMPGSNLGCWEFSGRTCKRLI